jgi:hypothetical protein
MDQQRALPSAYGNNSHEVNDRIMAVAAGQRRHITTPQLIDCGLGPSGINRRVRSRWLFHTVRRVYTVGGPCTDATDLRCAHVLACPTDSMLGGLASIELRAFTRFRARNVTIETPVPCRLQFDDTYALTTSPGARLGYRELEDAVPAASLPWALLRAGRELTSQQICHVIHQACWRRILDISVLQHLLATHRHVPGHRVVADAVTAYLNGSAGTRSILEDRFVTILERVLGHVPPVNIHVTAGGELIEVDVPFLDRRICLEVDGPPHDQPNQQDKDRARDAKLTSAGFRVHRFHWRQIDFAHWEVERRLREIFV